MEGEGKKRIRTRNPNLPGCCWQYYSPYLRDENQHDSTRVKEGIPSSKVNPSSGNGGTLPGADV